ncbi:MAG: hypothetical protein FD123_2338 [Bacteroidetes bacterium]|nr:MAG: hypothetical protein FD123_2338 [Bacteroidota bacterium]
MFFNPFDLIGIPDVADEQLQRERRRVLNEIELADGWSGNGISMEKWEVIRVLDDLLDPALCAHYRLLLRHRSLNDFLVHGDKQFFDQPLPDDPALQNEAFLHFISPHFLHQYGLLLRDLLFQDEQEARLQEAVRKNDDDVAAAIRDFDEAMQTGFLEKILRYPCPVHPSRRPDLFEAIHAYCTALHQHLGELAQVLRGNRIYIWSAYESLFVAHPEQYIVRFAKKMKQVLHADSRLFLGVSVLANILRREFLPDSNLNDRAANALGHYAAFLDCFTTELTKPGERGSAGEDYFVKMIMRREACLAEEKNVPFRRLNVHIAYFYSWLALEGPLKRERFGEAENELLEKLRSRLIMPSEFFERAGCGLTCSEDVVPKMHHFCDVYLGYMIKGQYNKTVGTQLFDVYDREESWEDYDKMAPCFQKQYENELGVPAIVEAARNNDLEKVQACIKSGDDVDAIEHTGYSALLHAALNGDFEISKLLITSGADVNKEDKYGSTPLELAASFGHREVVALLLDAGADVNLKTKKGHTAVYEAVRNEENGEEIVRMLIAAGATIHDCGPEPIICNCWRHVDVVRLLVAHGADINGVNREGNTLLHIISGWCRNDSISSMDDVQLLLDCGADPKIPNAAGKLPEELVAEHGNPIILGLFRR